MMLMGAFLFKQKKSIMITSKIVLGHAQTENKTTDRIRAGDIVTSGTNILLVTETDYDAPRPTFEGIVLHSTGMYEIGDCTKKEWYISVFKPFIGEILLTCESPTTGSTNTCGW